MSNSTHQLHHSTRTNLATCRCGRWTLTDLKKPLSKEAAKTNFALHKEMVNGQVR